MVRNQPGTIPMSNPIEKLVNEVTDKKIRTVDSVKRVLKSTNDKQLKCKIQNKFNTIMDIVNSKFDEIASTSDSDTKVHIYHDIINLLDNLSQDVDTLTNKG